jgi:hypothetical protein
MSDLWYTRANVEQMIREDPIATSRTAQRLREDWLGLYAEVERLTTCLAVNGCGGASGVESSRTGGEMRPTCGTTNTPNGITTHTPPLEDWQARALKAEAEVERLTRCEHVPGGECGVPCRHCQNAAELEEPYDTTD